MKNISIKSAILIILFTVNVNILAQNTGPTAPEAMSFEPVDAANMVNMNTGDFVYSIPIINIPGPGGGYPLALSYHGGIAVDQEASWVGLGWNINPGAINRGVMGIPDDIKGEGANTLVYNYLGSYTHRSVGVGIVIEGLSLGAQLSWNQNWSQWTFAPYVGLGLPNDLSINAGIVVGTEFGITAGVGKIGGFGYVGVGIGTWGSSFSVGAGVGPASFRVNMSHSETTFGMNVSAPIGGNGNNDKFSGTSASMGISLSSEGNVSVGGSVGLNSFSTNSDDYNMSGENIYSDHSSWAVNLIVFNMSYDNVRWWYWDNETSIMNGYLYQSESYFANGDTEEWRDDVAQHKDYLADVMTIPYSRDEIIHRYKSEGYANLMLPGADHYVVNAQGINGTMSLKYYEPALLVSSSRVQNHVDLEAHRDYNKIDIELYYATVAGDGHGATFSNDDAQLKQMPDEINPYFYFENVSTGGMFNCALEFENYNTSDKDPIWGYYKVQSYPAPNNFKASIGVMHNNRIIEGNYIEYYTNKQITENLSDALERGFIETQSIVTGQGRDSENYFAIDGIGAFSITTNDGVTYHYSLPVYQFEEFNNHEQKDKVDFYVHIQNAAYAYTWLLTGITGPDYIDMGGGENGNEPNGYLDNEDLGYWVNFKYGKWTDSYFWHYDSDNNEYKHFGAKQIYYLNEIETKTHVAYFIKKVRNDAHSKEMSFNKSYDHGAYLNYTDATNQFGPAVYKVTADKRISEVKVESSEIFPLSLDKIILINKADKIDGFTEKSTWNATDKTTYGVGYKYTNFELSRCQGELNPLIYIVPPTVCQLIQSSSYLETGFKVFDNYYDQNVIDINDFNSLSYTPNILKEVRLNYDETSPLCINSPNSPNGKLTLKSLEFFGKNEFPTMPPYYFDYYRLDNNYDENDADKWGFHKDYADNWSLKSITTPIGAVVEVKYQSDSYTKEAIFGEIRHEIIDEKLENPLESYWNYETGMQTFVFNIPGNNNFDDFFGLGEDYDYNLDGVINFADVYADLDRVDYNIKRNADPMKFTVEIVSYSVDDGVGEESDRYVSGVIIKDTENGGGIRVESISLTDDNNTYTTNYNYHGSGITSYTPAHRYEFVPLPSELPAPCVYYGHVSVSNENSEMHYYYETPEISTNHKEPEMNMGEQLSINDIQANYNLASPWIEIETGDHDKYAFARSAIIEDKTSGIGRINSVETMNSSGDILTEQKYVYADGLSNQETYYYLKNVVDWTIGHSQSENNFYFVSTSKRTVPSVLKAVHTSGNGFTQSLFNMEFDPISGKAVNTTTVYHQQGDLDNIDSPDDITSKLLEISTEILPTYQIDEYRGEDGVSVANAGMGSKVYNPNNKNMLTQEAISLSKKNGKVINVGIQTWKGNWNNYLDWDTDKLVYEADNPDQSNIWRKHKSFVWNGTLNADGTYGSDFTDVYDFADINYYKTNWNTHFGGGDNGNWIKTSEIVRYDHFSSPIEVTDINGDFAATKKDPEDLYTVVTAANARHSQFAHCSFEFAPYINKQGESGVYIENNNKVINETTHEVHTGFSCYLVPIGTIGLGYKVCSTEVVDNWGDITAIEVSYWGYENNPGGLSEGWDIIRCMVGGATVSGSSIDYFKAGNWKRVTQTFEIAKNGEVQIYLENTAGTDLYIDDFRIAPYEAAVMAYTYDNAGNVTSISNNDNFATKYEYDDAGRLIGTYVEKPSGFERISKHVYHYENLSMIQPSKLPWFEAIVKTEFLLSVTTPDNQSWTYTAPDWVSTSLRDGKIYGIPDDNPSYVERWGEIEILIDGNVVSKLSIGQKGKEGLELLYPLLNEPPNYTTLNEGDNMWLIWNGYDFGSGFKQELYGYYDNEYHYLGDLKDFDPLFSYYYDWSTGQSDGQWIVTAPENSPEIVIFKIRVLSIDRPDNFVESNDFIINRQAQP